MGHAPWCGQPVCTRGAAGARPTRCWQAPECSSSSPLPATLHERPPWRPPRARRALPSAPATPSLRPPALARGDEALWPLRTSCCCRWESHPPPSPTSCARLARRRRAHRTAAISLLPTRAAPRAAASPAQGGAAAAAAAAIGWQRGVAERLRERGARREWMRTSAADRLSAAHAARVALARGAWPPLPLWIHANRSTLPRRLRNWSAAKKVRKRTKRGA